MMNKKDEAIKKCLRVLEPIANERMYETQWVDSAIRACHEALEEKEWQGLTEDERLELIKECKAPYHAHAVEPMWLCQVVEKKLKEKNT
jgi:hypothetical protein